ncbi:UNVERIFIED_ORG: hypothetical protein DFS12_107103 [Chitinophaga ginsengisegetis]|nr:hypothetical protein [Chitinophaga ginsengisegetis]MDR6649674.1 hypothetical protein [Chitinophaga ginsengisegetis]MDR6656123.1 hypothetical protein [Chitinophaga ginsengisegetis]
MNLHVEPKFCTIIGSISLVQLLISDIYGMKTELVQTILCVK